MQLAVEVGQLEIGSLERAQRIAAFIDAYRWAEPVFAIAAINGDGCRELVYAIQDWLEKHPAEIASAASE